MAAMPIYGIDKEYRQKEGFSDFVGATEKGSATSLCNSIIEDVNCCNRSSLKAFDATLGEEVILKTDIAMVVADFNMLAFVCNHMGSSANKYCPKCNGDVSSFKEKSRLRTPAETLHTLDRLSLRSSEADRKRLRTATGIKEYKNPFWDIINPHRDVPSGLLHLFHLGVSKHLIKFILDNISADQVEDVQMHLTSLDSAQKPDFNIKYIESRQGKDIKKLIQVIPFSLAFAGVRQIYITMICLLCEIHQLVHLPVLKHEDLQTMERVVGQYLQLVDDHAPSLQTKVKTHLLTHMENGVFSLVLLNTLFMEKVTAVHIHQSMIKVDEIKQHGPPTSYSEDVFEKRHKTIRAKIFQQENQLARSRDTALIFARNVIFKHVISGGYFQADKKWVQSSQHVQLLAKQKEILQFLGEEVMKDNHQNSLAKAVRSTDRKSEQVNVAEFHPASLILQGLIDAGIPSPRLEGSLIMYSAITLKNSVLNKGDPVMYVNREDEEQIGILQGGLLILQQKRLQFAKIVPCRKVEETKIGALHSLSCVKSIDVEELVPLQNVLRYVPLIHDCVQGNCTRKESKVSKRIEQEIVEVVEKRVYHNKNHKLYFVNLFSLLFQKK